MLINKTDFRPAGLVIIMSDLTILAASTKAALLEIAKQASALGLGLQNAAPSMPTPNNSVLYLLEIAEELEGIAKRCDNFSS